MKSIFNSEIATTVLALLKQMLFQGPCMKLSRQETNSVFLLVRMCEKLLFHVMLIVSYPFINNCVELDSGLNLNFNRKASIEEMQCKSQSW